MEMFNLTSYEEEVYPSGVLYCKRDTDINETF